MRLTVVGVVDKPVTLTYDQLIEGFTPHSVVTALACAGNRRAELCGIGRVDVSLDEGRTWRQADLQPVISQWVWRLWSLTIEARPGPITVTARAWDDTGVTQTGIPGTPVESTGLWQ